MELHITDKKQKINLLEDLDPCEWSDISLARHFINKIQNDIKQLNTLLIDRTSLNNINILINGSIEYDQTENEQDEDDELAKFDLITRNIFAQSTKSVSNEHTIVDPSAIKYDNIPAKYHDIINEIVPVISNNVINTVAAALNNRIVPVIGNLISKVDSISRAQNTADETNTYEKDIIKELSDQGNLKPVDDRGNVSMLF